MIIINYGGGLNSTALIIEAVLRGMAPDHILFAETGSEKPGTYEFLAVFRRWLAMHGLEITSVRWMRKRGTHAGEFVSIHQQCLERSEFPSVTYGLKGCTSKWKQQPLDQHVRAMLADVPESVEVERWLGYDADEPERWERARALPNVERWTWRAPLVEWDMGRSDCRRTILAAGLPLPPRSSCFMCRNMRPAEIRELNEQHPETMAIALEIERRGLAALKEPGSLAGLGGSASWADIIQQQDMFLAPTPDACIACWDGDE